MSELWETLVDLADAVAQTGAASELVRVTALEMDLPLEVVLDSRGFQANLPRWRLPTEFDLPRSRLRLSLQKLAEDA